MNRTVLTLDIDWAPDFVVDAVAAILREHGVKATWYVTNASPAVERLRAEPELFELGIHPNFMPESSHGSTMPEVLDHVLRIVPEAVSMRTHNLVQSSDLVRFLIHDTPIQADVSLFTPGIPDVQPVQHWNGGKYLLRLPFVWSDDYEWQKPAPEWHYSQPQNRGLNIYGFHPIHIYLNSCNVERYQRLREDPRPLYSIDRHTVDSLVHDGDGVKSFFESIVDVLANQPSHTTHDVVREWQRSMA